MNPCAYIASPDEALLFGHREQVLNQNKVLCPRLLCGKPREQMIGKPIANRSNADFIESGRGTQKPQYRSNVSTLFFREVNPAHLHT